MQALHRYRLEALQFPIAGYSHIVKTITSIDGGRTYYFCGHARYFRTAAEARAYKEEREARE